VRVQFLTRGKVMKKVLLTTTAMAFAASMASANDKITMSGAIKLSYGAFGTGDNAGAATDDFLSEADLDVSASSSSGQISMDGTLEIDEGGTAAGPVAIGVGALTFTYDNDEISELAVAPTEASGGDGESDNYGDYKIAFELGGIAVTYVKDQESSDNSMGVAYESGALKLSLTSLDETNGPTDIAAGLQYGSGDNKTTIGAEYVMGAYTIKLSGDDQTDQDWDASVAMENGDTTLTLAADETNMMSVGISYTNGPMSVTARQEFNNAAGTDDETEIKLSYTEGALTFSAASDSGQKDHYGDEAQMLIKAAYTDGDVVLEAKGTDQDEMEVSVTFAF